MKSGVIAALALLTLASVVVQGQVNVTCGQVTAALTPCISYLTGKGDSPSTTCCNGVKTVKSLTPTTADRRACCTCIKAAASHYADLNDDAAKNLPTKCGVQIDIPISRTVDCDKIN